MLKYIFFFFNFFILFYELVWFTNAKAAFGFVKEYRAVTNPKEFTIVQAFYTLFTLFYSFILVLGVFSSQWPIFIVIAMMGHWFPKTNWKLLMFDAGFTSLLLVFAILNAFKMHINYLEVIKNIF